MLSPSETECDDPHSATWWRSASSRVELLLIFNHQSVIAERFPMVSIEKDFEEHDLLWFPNDRETDEAMQTRMSRAMDRLFNGAAPETCTCSLMFSRHSPRLSFALHIIEWHLRHLRCFGSLCSEHGKAPQPTPPQPPTHLRPAHGPLDISRHVWSPPQTMSHEPQSRNAAISCWHGLWPPRWSAAHSSGPGGFSRR